MQIEDDFSFAGPGDLVVIPLRSLFQEVISEPVWRITIQLQDTPHWKPLQDIGAYIRHYESTPLLFILMRNILDAYRSQHPLDIRMSLDSSRALINLLNHEMVTMAGGMRPHRNKLKAVFDDFSRDPMHRWTVAEMAGRVSLSEGHFTSLFRQEFNMSPIEAVIRERMRAAGMRLTTTDDLLDEVAASVGYNSMYSFARLFKKHMGISPGKYRKLHRQREWE